MALYRPKIYEGGAEILYHDRDGDYQIVLSWMDTRYEPAEDVYQPVAIREDFLYTFPLCLFVNEVGTGLDKHQEFMEKVGRYHAEFLGQEDAQAPWYTDNVGPGPPIFPRPPCAPASISPPSAARRRSWCGPCR